MDIEDPKTTSSTLLLSSSSPINPTLCSSVSSPKSTIVCNQSCLPITLSQRDFVNSDFLVQSLFLYVLRKSGGEQTGDLQEGCYYMCKYLSPQYSIGCNGSLTIRVKYLDPINRDCDPITCSRIVTKREEEEEQADLEVNQAEKQKTEFLKCEQTQPKILSNNAVLFEWIEKLLAFYSHMFSESETIDILQTISATKNHVENIHSRIAQIKLYHELREGRLQEISENRLNLMRTAAKQYVQEHFEETDFILITYFQADLSAERVRFIEIELNPAALSLLGTHSSQFTNLIMRNGLQMCHPETHIADLFYQSLKKLVFEQNVDVNEFIVPDQRLVLIDRIIMTCDFLAVILQNTWDRSAPFIPKHLETSSKNGLQKYSLESVFIQKILISPEQIKEILDIRAAQQSLQSVSDKENQFGYTVESENFCERFYPEIRLENSRQNSKEKGRDQQTKIDEKETRKMCGIKDI